MSRERIETIVDGPVKHVGDSGVPFREQWYKVERGIAS